MRGRSSLDLLDFWRGILFEKLEIITSTFTHIYMYFGVRLWRKSNGIQIPDEFLAPFFKKLCGFPAEILVIKPDDI